MRGSTAAAIIGCLFGLFMGIIILSTYPPIKQTQPKPEVHKCKCLTYHQLSYYSTKYDIYMDSLNYSSKKDRPRLADSTRKYGQILRQND